MVFRDEFNNRLAEVNKYFDFLEKIESEYKILMNHSKTLSFTIDDELLKILKANGFLILYNLIEATILNSIIAIFDEIKVDNLSYEKVSEKIKKYWFKNKYKHSDAIKDENLNNKFYILVEEVISNITLEIIKDRIEYGGNIDARRIKEISENQKLSVQYLEQILFKLKKSGIIVGKRGPNGGYRLNKEPKDISILEIFNISLLLAPESKPFEPELSGFQ